MLILLAIIDFVQRHIDKIRELIPNEERPEIKANLEKMLETCEAVKYGAPTAQSNGIASVQCGYGNTAPLQIEFDPHVGADENGVDVVLGLIEGHFAQGGTLININVLDTQRLMEVHKNPDLHPDLVVRVTGFTAYFASLTPQFRQLVIDRFLK